MTKHEMVIDVRQAGVSISDTVNVPGLFFCTTISRVYRDGGLKLENIQRAAVFGAMFQNKLCRRACLGAPYI